MVVVVVVHPPHPDLHAMGVEDMIEASVTTLVEITLYSYHYHHHKILANPMQSILLPYQWNGGEVGLKELQNDPLLEGTEGNLDEQVADLEMQKATPNSQTIPREKPESKESSNQGECAH